MPPPKKKKKTKRKAKPRTPADPRKLTPQQIEQRAALVAKLREARSDLDSAVEEYNAAALRAWSKVDKAIQRYNAALGPVGRFVAGRLEQITALMQKKGDAFGLTEEDAALERMRYEWEALPLVPLHTQEPDPFTLPVDDTAEDLENLPSEL
jgi:hypothetical protein